MKFLKKYHSVHKMVPKKPDVFMFLYLNRLFSMQSIHSKTDDFNDFPLFEVID